MAAFNFISSIMRNTVISSYMDYSAVTPRIIIVYFMAVRHFVENIFDIKKSKAPNFELWRSRSMGANQRWRQSRISMRLLD